MPIEMDARAYLRITGSGSVDRISELLGIGPDAGWSAGEVKRRGRGTYPFSNWEFHSGEMKGQLLDTHLRSLWRRVEPYREKLIQLGPEYSRYLICTARFPTRDAEFTVAAGHFSTAAYYRLETDFDFYFEDGFGDEAAGKSYAAW